MKIRHVLGDKKEEVRHVLGGKKSGGILLLTTGPNERIIPLAHGHADEQIKRPKATLDCREKNQRRVRS